MDKNVFWKRTLLLILTGTLTLGGVSLLAFPAPVLSERENRMLTERPQYSTLSLLRGEYCEAWNLYAAERLPAKETLRSIKAVLELLQLKQESNGVMLTATGRELRRPAREDTAVLHRNLKRLDGILAYAREQQCPTVVAVVPRATELGDTPFFYRTHAEQMQRKVLTSLIPEAEILYDTLSPDDYYRTDHHWNAEGVWRAYLALSERLGFVPVVAERQILSTDFKGTSDAAAGIPFIAADTLATWRFAGDELLSVRREGEAVPLYDLSKLSGRDKYAVFPGAATGVLEIDFGEGDTRPTLALVRDSFAGALLPLLAAHFKIRVVDPRYVTTPLMDTIKGADILLVLCGMQSLADTAFFR